MAAGHIKVLGDLTLSASEQASGYTDSSNATDGGPDVQGMFLAALADLRAAAAKLTAINAVLPAGSNKTAISGELTKLTATS